jgi:hypothetical protein
MITLKITKRNFDKAIKLSRKVNTSLNCAVAVAARDNLKLFIIGVGLTEIHTPYFTLKCIEGNMSVFTQKFDSLLLFRYNNIYDQGEIIDEILELRSTLPLIFKYEQKEL